MKEREFEDILTKYPELIEDGLNFKGRQVNVRGKFLDLLFEDRHGQMLIVEIKKGPIKREHIAQLMDYEGHFILSDDPTVRVMLIGNRVPNNLKRALDHHGFEWKEIRIEQLVDFLQGRGDSQLLGYFNDDIMASTIPHRRKGQLAKQAISSTARHKVKFSDKSGNDESDSQHTEKLTDITNNSLSAGLFKNYSHLSEVQPSFSIPGFTSKQSAEFANAYHSFIDVVLQRKIAREAAARKILVDYCGSLTYKKIDHVFDLVDKDPTGPWFGQMLSRPNRNRIFACPEDELNELFNRLISTGDLRWLGHWREKGNSGMSYGGASLILYLYDPKKHNVWVKKIHQGLITFNYLQSPYPGNNIAPDEMDRLYRQFNQNSIAFREKYGFSEYSIDWVFWAIGEIMNNLNNRYLRAYIDGTVR